ncbi:hypothetical protein N781_12750 [Pontibacillus halophilus JSM 076056 = DSM 19796]|uniref:DUF3397 domain-containing protein n=1 Tax=Pontibacillus halophilus JSM 076056 = DSM 19796 TaxID=1385510 RepID=A0A0A5IBW1_9BACI|nr:DUF3397 domain-containing protein [Pontibacillus halophilus]KGX93332.1 hypothetical protein N781_12750 [Pontibacillus halophilus JSM 076056 = DSM 19796]
MNDVLAYLFAIVITMPIPTTLVVFFIARKFYRRGKPALRFAINTTVLVYILAVEVSLFVIFERSYFWYILLFLIVLLSMFVILQWKYKKDIYFMKAWKGFWRLSFFLFMMAYVGLTVYGVTERILAL